MLLGAVIAIEIRSLLSAVVSIGIVGFALCIVFLMLQAPDVAITQLIVEVIVLVMLIRATGVRQDDTEVLSSMKETFAFLTILLFMAVFAICGFYALQHLPAFGEPLLTVSQTFISQGMAKTGAVNLVSAVLLDFRAYDTLGEVTVLFAAIWGVVLVLRKKGRKKIDERDD
ncbi:MAG: hydrogen gas-evolving membrane-bound hydrogenase subunit E [bacterium]